MLTFPRAECLGLCSEKNTKSAGKFFEPPNGDNDNNNFSFRCFPLKPLSFFRLNYLNIFKQNIYFVTFLVLNRKKKVKSTKIETFCIIYEIKNKKHACLKGHPSNIVIHSATFPGT